MIKKETINIASKLLKRYNLSAHSSIANNIIYFGELLRLIPVFELKEKQYTLPQESSPSYYENWRVDILTLLHNIKTDTISKFYKSNEVDTYNDEIKKIDFLTHLEEFKIKVSVPPNYLLGYNIEVISKAGSSVFNFENILYSLIDEIVAKLKEIDATTDEKKSEKIDNLNYLYYKKLYQMFDFTHNVFAECLNLLPKLKEDFLNSKLGEWAMCKKLSNNNLPQLDASRFTSFYEKIRTLLNLYWQEKINPNFNVIIPTSVFINHFDTLSKILSLFFSKETALKHKYIKISVSDNYCLYFYFADSVNSLKNSTIMERESIFTGPFSFIPFYNKHKSFTLFLDNIFQKVDDLLNLFNDLAHSQNPP